MQREARRPRPVLLQVGLSALALAFFVAAYIVAMNALVEVSRGTDDADRDRRDAIYLAVHGGFLFVAAIYGFTLGKWLSGLGLAFALLFVVTISVLMLTTQLVSFELACRGHNDLVRHWTC